MPNGTAEAYSVMRGSATGKEESQSMEIAMTVIGGIILFAVISAFVKAPGNLLQQKFGNLGQLPGKTKEEIIAVVGPPNSISAAGDGKSLLQWITPGYHVALLFEGEACLGITHEFSG
jgi:hypothetical protein